MRDGRNVEARRRGPLRVSCKHELVLKRSKESHAGDVSFAVVQIDGAFDLSSRLAGPTGELEYFTQ